MGQGTSADPSLEHESDAGNWMFFSTKRSFGAAVTSTLYDVVEGDLASATLSTFPPTLRLYSILNSELRRLDVLCVQFDRVQL